MQIDRYTYVLSVVSPFFLPPPPSLPSLAQACNPALTEFDCSCFNGEYVTGAITPEYLAGLETSRADDALVAAMAGVSVAPDSRAAAPPTPSSTPDRRRPAARR